MEHSPGGSYKMPEDFDFLNTSAEADAPPLTPEVLADMEHGPNLQAVNGMTRKKFTQGVLNVYQALGGDMWLLQQAQIDPKSFIDMLKKMVPTNMSLDQMDGFEITVIDRYGNQATLSPRESGSDPKPLRTAPHGGPEGTPSDLAITERFSPALPSQTVPTERSKGFDFEV
jgi:hypothetical protein